MIIKYKFDSIDRERQEKKIVDIKNKNMQLRIYFKDYIKIYGIIVIFLLLIVLISFLRNTLLLNAMIVVFLMSLIAISVIYFFKYYKIKYDSTREKLMIKKWYGTVQISKNKIKKIYVKRGYAHGRAGAGTNLYINYANDKDKEKYILLDIFFLRNDELKEFLDIFVI